MGWAYCGQDDEGRDIGYAVEAICDEPGCNTKIDRGLAHVCGPMHGHCEYGCGKYFCGEHLFIGEQGEVCRRCIEEEEHREVPE